MVYDKLHKTRHINIILIRLQFVYRYMAYSKEHKQTHSDRPNVFVISPKSRLRLLVV